MLTRPTRFTRWTCTLLACILTLLAHRVTAQTTDSAKTAMLSTVSGVFTAAQAERGRTVYQATCRSCHTPGELAGATFWNGWVGRTLGELFGYIRSSMPKDVPASLADEDYADVTSYLLKVNLMPPGEHDLPSDSTLLARIRVVPPDTIKKGTRQ